jgi:hypothetical protein
MERAPVKDPGVKELSHAGYDYTTVILKSKKKVKEEGCPYMEELSPWSVAMDEIIRPLNGTKYPDYIRGRGTFYVRVNQNGYD